MKSIAFFLSLILYFFFHSENFASTGAAISNGNWNAPSTWSFSRVPGNNDTIIVPSGKTVNVNLNSPTYVNMVVTVSGTLDFNNGSKLNFDCNSVVSISATGKLDGGNPGSKIDMCGSTVWRGPGPTAGPLVYGFNPLPINLLSFSAQNCDNQICLSWTTLTESNNDYFSIEKTKDDISYEQVGIIKGSGNSSSIRHYSFKDEKPYDGISYYRLKQTDFNGDFVYFALREVDRDISPDFSLQLFPNPGSQHDVKLLLRSQRGNEILVVVYDVMGRIAFSKVLVLEQSGENVVALDTFGNLKKGIYMVTGTSDKTLDSKKLIIN